MYGGWIRATSNHQKQIKNKTVKTKQKSDSGMESSKRHRGTEAELCLPSSPEWWASFGVHDIWSYLCLRREQAARDRAKRQKTGAKHSMKIIPQTWNEENVIQCDPICARAKTVFGARAWRAKRDKERHCCVGCYKCKQGMDRSIYWFMRFVPSHLRGGSQSLPNRTQGALLPEMINITSMPACVHNI